MANRNHLKILMQGVQVGNKWREEHRDVILEANLVDQPRIALTLYVMVCCLLKLKAPDVRV